MFSQKPVSPLLISENLAALKSEIPEGIALVAVSKFQPVEALQAAYDAGQRLFGESRVQELLEKIPLLPQDIKWHFIGHLQTNKVRQIIGRTALIESVDSEKLIDLIDAESSKAGVETKVLMQVHVAAEYTKFGFTPDELLDFFRRGRHRELKNTVISGLMAMATNTDDETVIRSEFRTASNLFRTISGEFFDEKGSFRTLSMGMSSDWPIAVEEGATLIRVGSAIFGERN